VAKTVRTPREEIERAFHVSFKTPQQAGALLDAYRDQVRTDAAAMLRAYCPDHGTADTAFMDCHCPAADAIDRDAARTTPALEGR
jgi:hypothetical protein